MENKREERREWKTKGRKEGNGKQKGGKKGAPYISLYFFRSRGSEPFKNYVFLFLDNYTH
jgi:hypothetical protein